MTIENVISSEYPLQPIKGNGKLEYSKVNIGNGFLAKIIYTFRNKKLTKVNYSVYRVNQNSNKKAATITPLNQKVMMIEYVFEAFKLKGYKCWLGWHMNVVTPKEMLELFGSLKKCDLDKEFVKKIDTLAKNRNSIDTTVSFENDRSKASFRFNEYQNERNYKYYQKPEWLRKGLDFTLTDVYYWLEIKPNSKVKKEMNSTRF